ncbi:hypothetical protein UVI_02045970 [Ustilaginoidea virens]|uniref:Uncharacterized protein n=1 Tax=Ustilaginoidea virens TaxID=1159556 RepID=A0A063BVE3_USTVR|nr:hypothetical protein UVI_02045970 [Ustilaginoidea virens]
MGLPLFVEPVASDLPNKRPAKASSLRADPGRVSRSEIRDRRVGTRRAGSRIYGPLQRDPPHNTRERDQNSGVAAANATSVDRRSGRYRQALREMAEYDEDRRERLEEHVNMLYSNSWQVSAQAAGSEDENMSEGVSHSRWSFGPRSWRTRLQRSTRVSDRLDAPSTIPPEVSARTAPHPRAADAPASQSRAAGSLSAARQTMPDIRGAVGLDGLGDRERSLSPEGWDTLLSTLTPDPQPPSAGSSFAAVAASQTAGPSSATPTTVSEAVEDGFVDAPCESGCEGSDNEMEDADYGIPEFLRIVRRRAGRLGEADSRRVPENNLNRVADEHARRPRASNESRSTRQINTPHGQLTIYESTRRLGPSGDLAHAQSTSQPGEHSRSWNGPFAAHAASGERQHSLDGALQSPDESSSATQANPMAAEDDWSGMQRIVRSLARREDIPDGWWAEAGLSRILQQRETVPR